MWSESPDISNNRLQVDGTLQVDGKLQVESRLAITRLAITRIGYNAVGRGPRISVARGEMGATANNNAVINRHLFLWSPHVCLVQVYLETIYWY